MKEKSGRIRIRKGNYFSQLRWREKREGIGRVVRRKEGQRGGGEGGKGPKDGTNGLKEDN